LQWHSSIFSQTYAEAETKVEKERVILVIMEERGGVVSRGPALPWKQDGGTIIRKLFKIQGEQQAVCSGDGSLRKAVHIIIDAVSLKDV
jgi:hypothetical protein